MRIIPNPENRKHLQTNKDEYSGTIYQSKNISLDEDGKIILAPMSYAVMTEDDDVDFIGCDAMLASDGSVFLNSKEMFSGDVGFDVLSNRSGDTNAVTPATEDDVVFFNDTEVVSDGTLIKYRSASTTWTTVSLSFSASYPIAMTTWESQDVVCAGNNNQVKFIDTSWAISATVLTLPNEYQVSSMCSVGSQLFVATRSKSGGEAKVFVVSTIQTAVDYGYGVGSFEMPSIKPYRSSFVGINSVGQLLLFNGGGFDELASLPIYAKNVEWADALNDYSTVNNRGIVVEGDLVFIFLSSRTNDGRYLALPYFPSGVWCYDFTNGALYHRHSLSYTRLHALAGSNVTVDTTANDFTLTSGNLNSVATGMPVLYEPLSAYIPELRTSTAYYLIKDSSTEFRLASTYTDALAGTEIDITDVGDTFQQFHVFMTNDYGWTTHDAGGAIAVLNNLLFDSDIAGNLAFTGDVGAKQNVENARAVLNGITPYVPNRGYFVTPRFTSLNLEDQYVATNIKYRPLDTDEKIIVKYKTNDKHGIPFSSIQYGNPATVRAHWIATWSDTDTFTTTFDMSSVGVGDEIEIIGGVGAGHLSHVASISEASGTYTVNLDEAFPWAVSGDELWFQVDNWTYAFEINSSTQNGDEFSKIPITKSSKFIQLKVELRGIGVTVEELQVVDNLFKPSI